MICVLKYKSWREQEVFGGRWWFGGDGGKDEMMILLALCKGALWGWVGFGDVGLKGLGFRGRMGG
jgi:hypothetical protein